MRPEYQKPPWKRDNVVQLPTSRTCPNVSFACKIAKAHVLFNDAIEMLQEGYREMEPRTPEAMEAKEILKDSLSAMRKLEEGIGPILMFLGKDCDDLLKCRC